MLDKKTYDALNAAIADIRNEFAAADAANQVKKGKKINALLASFSKEFRGLTAESYKVMVESNKAANAEKKAAKIAAFEEAKKAKEEAKVKLAAAKALVEKKPTRGKKKAKGKAAAAAFKPRTELIKKAKRVDTPTAVVDSMAEGLIDLPNL